MLIRPTYRGKKNDPKSRRQNAADSVRLVGVCSYFDGEELAFGLGEKLFKTKVAGNGWVLGALNKGQPEEIVPFCKTAVAGERSKESKEAWSTPGSV